ncbi:TPA: antitermination protein [Salmonella enterica]
MKLEAALKHFSPQGMHISDSVHGTSPDRITGTDVMAAIGTTSSRARFGLAAFFGKAGISKTDEQQAVQALARYAMDCAPKNVRKSAGQNFGQCMLLLAQFAFAEYARSASTSAPCAACVGTGFTETHENVIKHPGITDKDGVTIVPPQTKYEVVKHVCSNCKGKGEIKARCRCGGKGEVLDRQATEKAGVPVFKICNRCNGKGFSSVSSATVHRAIERHIPALHQSSWSRNWKPFYEKLVDVCRYEEKKAKTEFEKSTTF